MATKYKIYQSLNKRLIRAGFSKRGEQKKFASNGKIAHYLCDLFLLQNGIVQKNQLISYGIIKSTDNLTNEFLETLVRTKFIHWDLKSNELKGFHPYQTLAAEKISDLINKESKEQFASKKEFMELRQEVLNQKKAIERLIEKFDPPCTNEKYQMFITDSTELIKDR